MGPFKSCKRDVVPYGQPTSSTLQMLSRAIERNLDEVKLSERIAILDFDRAAAG